MTDTEGLLKFCDICVPTKNTEQDVGQGQIGDKQIGDSLHGLVVADDKADERIAEQADHEDDDVQGVDVDLHGRKVDQVGRDRR